MFQCRVLVIATMHEKEKVIAPILEKELGVQCIIPPNFNSDTLGTFSGEIERKLDPISTARQKCLTALELTGFDLAVASEGSFGAHPALFFASADDEFLLFLDKKNKLEIVVRELSTNTNFNSSVINSEDELIEFAKAALFPSHGLILRNNQTDLKSIRKGISDWATLTKTYHEIARVAGTAFVETDMRAMFNPTRMNVIKSVTEKLLVKINSICTNCETPGFDVIEVKKGLPCELCHSPTKSTMSYVLKCKKCDFTRENKYPNKIRFENPMYCDNCNP
jgi:hypothetical protein